MLVRAVTGVDDGDIEVASDVMWGSRRRVPHNQAVGLHGVEVERGIEEGLALLQTGSFRLKFHRIGAEPGRCGAKADASASGGFEKGEGDRFTPKGSELFQRMAL